MLKLTVSALQYSLWTSWHRPVWRKPLRQEGWLRGFVMHDIKHTYLRRKAMNGASFICWPLVSILFYGNSVWWTSVVWDAMVSCHLHYCQESFQLLMQIMSWPFFICHHLCCLVLVIMWLTWQLLIKAIHFLLVLKYLQSGMLSFKLLFYLYF